MIQQYHFLEIYLNECDCDSGYYKGTSTGMFVAALTIAKIWKQPKCSTTNKWIKKMWYLYTMEFYSAMKKSEILSLASKWIELENIMLNELARLRRPKIALLHYMQIIDPKQMQ
jgi:hypothetical protein